MLNEHRFVSFARYARNKRTKNTIATPMAADATPDMRKKLSGDRATAAIARRMAPGKAAKRSPSIAKTRPRAVKKSSTFRSHKKERTRY
jgi:hypothetical protein